MNASTSRRDRQRADGFAIPAAIFVIIVLSLLALGGLYVAQSNAAANAAIRQSWRALYAADAGANRTLANWDRQTYGALDPGDSVDSGWRSLADGSQYRTTVLRVDDGQAGSPLLYRLRTIGRPARGSAQRVLATVVAAIPTTGICCEGAIKTRGQLRVQGTGNNAKADGRDIPPSEWSGQCGGPQGDLPGIRIQDDSDLILNGNPKIFGDPPVLEDETIGDDDFAVYDDLASMADKKFLGDQQFNNLAPASSGGTCLTSEPTNWGDPLDPSGPCWDYVPIIHVAGSLALSGNGYGQGILLVDGDLSVTGSFDFFGVIIVMGEADFKGTPRIVGGVLVRNGPDETGLSHLRGNEGIHFSSCVVERALSQATVTRPLSGRHWFELVE